MPATAGVPLGLSRRSRRGRHCRRTTRQFVNPMGLKGARIGVTRQGVDAVDAVVGACVRRRPCGDAEGGRDAGGPRRGAASSFRRATASSSCCCSISSTMCATTSPRASACRWPAGRSTISSRSTMRTPRSRCRSSGRTSSSWPRRSTPGPDAPQPVFGGMTYNQALKSIRLRAAPTASTRRVRCSMLDAIATPTGTPAWTTDVINGDHFEFATSTLAAIVGYPIVNVPMGNVFGLPVGISFIGTGVQRTDADSPGLGFRERDAGAHRAEALPDAAARRGRDPVEAPAPQGPRSTRQRTVEAAFDVASADQHEGHEAKDYPLCPWCLIGLAKLLGRPSCRWMRGDRHVPDASPIVGEEHI